MNKQMYLENLPYEKFESIGPEHMTESELLAIILRTGTREKSALQLAEEVLNLAGDGKQGLLGLYDLSVEKLQSIKGIGRVKAIKLKCLTELSMRIRRAKIRSNLRFDDAQSVAEYFMEKLRHRDTECVVLVCLDIKGGLICERIISDGSVRMSLISPREIFMEALQRKAVNIILIHNHPSGDPTPSKADISLTKTVESMGELMEIPLLDHVIIGDNSYASLRELGEL